MRAPPAGAPARDDRALGVRSTPRRRARPFAESSSLRSAPRARPPGVRSARGGRSRPPPRFSSLSCSFDDARLRREREELRAENAELSGQVASSRAELSRRDLRARVMESDDVRLLFLGGQGPQPKARGKVFWSEGAKRGVLVAGQPLAAPAGPPVPALGLRGRKTSRRRRLRRGRRKAARSSSRGTWRPSEPRKTSRSPWSPAAGSRSPRRSSCSAHRPKPDPRAEKQRRPKAACFNGRSSQFVRKARSRLRSTEKQRACPNGARVRSSSHPSPSAPSSSSRAKRGICVPC